jgi:hypothetical protein
MAKEKSLVKSLKKNTTILPKDNQPKLGQWYWVNNGEEEIWLGCAMKIGSNFIELHTPHSNKSGYSYDRIHMDDFHTKLTLEENPESVIKGKIDYWQAESSRLLKETRDLVLRLGLNPRHYLPESGQHAPEEPTTALVAISGKDNVETYKKDLIEAKEKTLPALFKAIKEANENLCKWMLAETMKTQALLGPMEQSIDDINNRIFSISIYAGLAESSVKISDGKSAELMDRLHIMQRKLYMDEECLLNYNAGGMEFSNIHEFDSWIAKAENRDRILPFPRTLVAMQVRRKTKERDSEGDMLQAFINIKSEISDEFTYLYLRNGEQLYRISCEMEFDRMIFPDKNLYDPSTPKMVKMFGNHIDEMIPVSEYEELLRIHNEAKIKDEQWKKDNPGKSWIKNPNSSSLYNFYEYDWKPFDQTNVYFDECMESVSKDIREYNRIALIIQGLFDRSMVLHPHLPVKSWMPDGFDKAIKLVYDGDMTINYGEPPDFEAYREKCNASLCADSITVGQELYWMKKEAEKENNRLDHDWRNKSNYRHRTFSPYGNPGPGNVSKISLWKKKSRVAVFHWERERLSYPTDSWGRRLSSTIPCSITVPASQLFNISAYNPGDYRQFFNDPRTREQYLKWAPLLLAAEDYYSKFPKKKDVVKLNRRKL